MDNPKLTHLRALEAESIHILREVAAEFQRPVMLVLDRQGLVVMVAAGAEGLLSGQDSVPSAAHRYHLQVSRDDRISRPVHAGNRRAADRAHQPESHRRTAPARSGSGTQKCCGLLKTRALLDALEEGGFDAAFGGARRDEEKSRAKERVYSFRDRFGQWDPKNQRPEIWNLYNGRIDKGESIRVFPLSNWTELDVWQYIHLENIPIVPLYFAKERTMVVRGERADSGGAGHPAAARREAADGDVPHALARLQSLHRRHPVRRPTPCPRSSRR